MTVTLLPSAEQVMVAWLTSQADITALVGGRVGTRLNGTLPAIRVTRVGNASSDVWQDNAALQVECWAAEHDQATADTLVRTVVAALPSIRHTTVPGGTVYTYSITAGPFWSPDDPQYSNNARYILLISLLVTT